MRVKFPLGCDCQNGSKLWFFVTNSSENDLSYIYWQDVLQGLLIVLNMT